MPPNSIVAGIPAVVKATRDSSPANRFNAHLYRMNAEAFARGEHRVWAKADLAAEAARFGVDRAS